MINLSIPQGDVSLQPRITVVGVGGAGGNAVNNMIEAGLEGVDFIVANTDAQALTSSRAGRVIQMGTQVTGGRPGGSLDSQGQATRRVGPLAAALVEADRKAARG